MSHKEAQKAQKRKTVKEIHFVLCVPFCGIPEGF
jgi:hypothetical protein